MSVFQQTLFRAEDRTIRSFMEFVYVRRWSLSSQASAEKERFAGFLTCTRLFSSLYRAHAQPGKPHVAAPVLRRGEVAEWSIVPHSKCGVPARVPWVQIPPSPPSCIPLS